MFAPRALARILSSSPPSSSSLLRIVSSPLSVGSCSALRRSFLTDFRASLSPNAPSSSNNALPATITAEQYEKLLIELKDFQQNLPQERARQGFLTPNRADPAVNDAILELYSEGFDGNWSQAKREEVGTHLKAEWEKGGDAALVIAINKLLENRVTLGSIVKSLGGWYPFVGLAAVIAVSKEIVLVNEELLLVTNFLAVFGGIYFAIADTVLDSYHATRNAQVKKYQAQRQLLIDGNKALLQAYDNYPKMVTLLEDLKKDVNLIFSQFSRAKFLKQKFEIQRRFQRALDSIVAAEKQAEADVYNSILNRFTDFVNFAVNLRKIRPEGFFADGFITAVTHFITQVPLKAENTPIGKLMQAYVKYQLWNVDWNNLKLGSWGQRFFGIYPEVKLAQTIAIVNRAQQADFAKFKKENPKASEQDYYKARGVKGKQSAAEFLRQELKAHPEKFKAAIANIKKEQAAWKEDLAKTLADSKANAGQTQVKQAKPVVYPQRVKAALEAAERKVQKYKADKELQAKEQQQAQSS